VASSFVERPNQAEKFFRKGEVRQLRTALSREQAETVITAHAPMMQRLGYTEENCGSVP